MRRFKLKPSGQPPASIAQAHDPRRPAEAKPSGPSSRLADNKATSAAITCFVGGTMIVTARGEMPVETLQPGELMMDMHEMPCRQPLLRIGRSRIDLAQLPDPTAVAPVLIRAGALMKGSPIRDLRVSPGEGILLDGRLVPARLLVNGTTIVQEIDLERVAYYYVWMEAHGLLIADGTLAESSFNDDWQRDYNDAANVTALSPAPRGSGTEPPQRCVPLLTEGPELLLIQQRLALLARGSNPMH